MLAVCGVAVVPQISAGWRLKRDLCARGQIIKGYGRVFPLILIRNRRQLAREGEMPAVRREGRGVAIAYPLRSLSSNGEQHDLRRTVPAILLTHPFGTRLYLLGVTPVGFRP